MTLKTTPIAAPGSTRPSRLTTSIIITVTTPAIAAPTNIASGLRMPGH